MYLKIVLNANIVMHIYEQKQLESLKGLFSLYI